MDLTTNQNSVTIGGHELLVDERSGLADPRLGRVDRAATSDLAEQPLGAAAGRRRVVDVNAAKVGMRPSFN